MDLNLRTIPEAPDAFPTADMVVDEPILVIWDGERCGPSNVKTDYGTRLSFGGRVIRVRTGADADVGFILFFWEAVVKQLIEAVKGPGDATAIIIHQDRKRFIAFPVTDDVTLRLLATAYQSSRPDDADAPADLEAEPVKADA